MERDAARGEDDVQSKGNNTEKLADDRSSCSTLFNTATFIHSGSMIQHKFRFRNITANHNGTVVSTPARNGPTDVVDIKSILSL